jgi:hypothetical protein
MNNIVDNPVGEVCFLRVASVLAERQYGYGRPRLGPDDGIANYAGRRVLNAQRKYSDRTGEIMQVEKTEIGCTYT